MKIISNISVLVFLFSLPSLFLPAQVLVIQSGSNFLNKNNLTLKGNWVNNGEFIDTTGTVIFTGSSQSLGGLSQTTFNNLTISAGSTTTVSVADQKIKCVLLSDGTLNAGGNITLLSTAEQTALIDGSGTGEVLGDITMQRYLPDAFGYKYISSPFQAALVSEFSDDVELGAAFPTFYEYVEDRVSSGWVNYTTTSNILYPLEGYAANFGDVSQPGTFDLNGTPNNGSIQLSLYNHNQPYTQGFNLVGSPFPSPIDWDAASGWTKTNIDNAVYYFNAGTTDQYTGTYSSYINGVSSDGIANNIIPSMQGFFVHVTDGTYPVSGTLGTTNSVRINDLTTTYHKSADVETLALLRISAGIADDENSEDPLVIYFDESASTIFESGKDALKMMNTEESVPNFYSFSSNSSRLSIDATPFPGEEIKTIPLGIKIEKSGLVRFKITDIQQMPIGLKVYFSDAVTGINQNLLLNPEYEIYLVANQYDNRFFIKFSTSEIENILTDGNSFNVYSSNGILKVQINYLPDNTGKLLISNMLGQIIWQQNINNIGTYQFQPNTGTGIYLVSLISGNEAESKKIFIQN